MQLIQNRRDFPTTLSAAGAASVLGARTPSAEEGPTETTTLRLIYDPSICTAPGYIADELLCAEGFTDIRYLRTASGGEAVARGEVDFGTDAGAWIVSRLDAGAPITALAGVHPGCAILKAADMCATEPERAVRRLVDGGFTERYDYALQTLTETPYTRWREFDPADSIRFYALRLHEVGMIESSPNAIIAEGTDWRFLHELKRELKA
jgi:hypothetical protein